MITVGMNYEVLEGKEKIFENAFQAVLAAMNKMPGHKHSRLCRDVHKPGSYVILSEWESQESFESFIRSEQFAQVTTWGKEQILKGRPSHRIYRTS